MKTVFLIEKLWTDSFENEVSASSGYAPFQVYHDRAKAEEAVIKGGVHKGSGWPGIEPGTPLLGIKELPSPDI